MIEWDGDVEYDDEPYECTCAGDPLSPLGCPVHDDLEDDDDA